MAITKQRGQDLYRQKRYKEALACFNEVCTVPIRSESHYAECGQQVLDSTADPSLDVLDNRAATYVKLGDFQKALKDGRRMIALGKQNVKVNDQ